MRNILGPKILRKPAPRGAQHATARWVIRIFFIHGFYLHLGRQGRPRDWRKALEVRNRIEEALMEP